MADYYGHQQQPQYGAPQGPPPQGYYPPQGTRYHVGFDLRQVLTRE